MAEWSLFVPGPPAAQPRMQVMRLGAAGFRLYTPRGPHEPFRAAINLQARIRWDEPLAGPVGVSIDAAWPRLQSETWKTKPMPSVWRPKKPDCDNVAKAVLDALTGVAWLDDSQVVKLTVGKRVAAGDETPGTRVVVFTLEDL